jgi:hypothetical protein
MQDINMMFLQECRAARVSTVRAMLQYFEIDEPLKSKGLEIARKDAIFSRDFDNLKNQKTPIDYQELIEMIFRNASRTKARKRFFRNIIKIT